MDNFSLYLSIFSFICSITSLLYAMWVSNKIDRKIKETERIIKLLSDGE